MIKVLDEICKPTKGSKYSAAIDLYAREDIIIGAGETIKVPLGVCIDEENMYKNICGDYPYIIGSETEIDQEMQIQFIEFKRSHYLQLEPRSSLRAKGIISCSGVIDIDFISHCRESKELKNGVCNHFKQK